MNQLTRPCFKSILLFLAIIIVGCNDTGKARSNQQAEKPESSTKDCIERVIAKDEELGGVRNHACESISLSETIHKYADGLAAINYDGCPEAFKSAFAKHEEAWRQMIPLTEKYPVLRGEMHDLFDQLEKSADADAFKPLLKAIWDTWAEVEEAIKR